MRLAYRMHAPSDEPALLRLWQQHAGWDQVTTEVWAHRLLRPPFGAASIIVAEDDAGSIVGQFAFIPAMVSIDGEERSALRPFAPILDPRVRSFAGGVNPMRQPIVAMYLEAVRSLRERGDALIYMVPDPRWRRLLRVFPFLQLGTFPLWSRALPLDAPCVMPWGFEARDVDPGDPRIDLLWQRARRLHGCHLVRDTRTLPWKVGGGDYTVLGVTRGDDLVGLVASKQKGDRQWLICDLLAADDGASLHATLTAATALADARARSTTPGAIRKVAVLATPVMEPRVRELGFTRDAYDFPLAVHPLDKSIPPSAVAPARWYVSAND